MSNAKDAQITGIIMIFFGGIVLISNPIFTIIHNLTHFDSSMIILFSIGIVTVGIGFFVAGLKYRNEHR